MAEVNGTPGDDELTGTPDDDLINGFGGDDRLMGLQGNDLLNGGEGDDRHEGGVGNDRYIIDSAGDVVIEAANEGDDWVSTRVSYTLAAGVSVETFTTTNAAGTEPLALAGNEFGQSIYGNAGDNRLTGDGGNDVLVGLGGNDTLAGGTGNDIYRIDDGGDLIEEAAAEGYDVLIGTVSYTLAAGASIEEMVAAGTTQPIDLFGNELDQLIYGNAGPNRLGGGGGNDRLEGGEGNDDLSGGAGNDTLNGGAGNDVLNGGTGDDRSVGGTGDDIYYVDSARDQVIENVNEGHDTVYTSVSYALRELGQYFDTWSRIEVLATTDPNGTTAINLTGDEMANSIYGNAGNNILNGVAGADLLVGGRGNDTYLAAFDDTIVELAGEGDDILVYNQSYTLAPGVSVETLAPVSSDLGVHYGSLPFTSTIRITGNEIGNSIYGSFAHNIIDGGGAADYMAGDRGDDTYHVDTTGDVVFEAEAENGGTDQVITQVSYTLPTNVENIRATASAGAVTLSGNELANRIDGNDANNLLRGLGGNDVIFGYGGNDILIGGAGADRMEGGTGNDTYHVDNAQDVIRDESGDDIVATSVSYRLDTFITVETLAARDDAGAIDLTGNAMANSIFGNGFNNILDGGGGADLLSGFGGDDTYRISDSRAVIAESAGGGFDRVFTSVSYRLSAGAEVEYLSTYSQTATDAINITGNEFDQQLIGNDGRNTLDGGRGVDQMVGRGGNDAYIVDHAGDTIVEASGEGDDSLGTSVSYALAAGMSIETMSAADGIASIDLTGNGFGQSLYGNAGRNELNGGGGIDYLSGGGGNDLFLFATAPGPGDVDVIADFQSGQDRIALENSVFTGLDGGALPAGAFVTGTQAQDADDRIIYDPATGALWFDADGNGAGAAVQFAWVTPGLTLSASDFLVV